MASSSWTLRTGAGTWSTVADWTPAPPAQGGDVTIGNAADTGNVAVTQDQTIGIKTLTLRAPASGSFTTTLTLTPANTLSVAGAIKLGTRTIINGTGTLVANGAITGGTIAASSGVLMLSGTGRIGAGPAFSIGSLVPSTLDLNLSGGVTAGAIAITSANQTLEIGAAGSLTMNAAENISNGAIQLDGGGLTDAAGLVVGAGATLKGKGTVTAPIAGTGVVLASGGVLDLTRALSAGPSYLIDTAAGSTLKVGGAAAAGTSFAFKGLGGTLELSNVTGGTVRNFNGSIAGLNVGASATIPTNDVNIQATVTKATLSGSLITVLNGTTTVATLHLGSAPSAGAYAVVRADTALGGYDVFLTSASNGVAPAVTWSPGTEAGTEGSAIALGTLAPSGGNPLTSVLVSGIPVGAKLADGTHSFTAATGSTSVNVLGWNYAGLTITPAGDANFTLSAQATDSANNVSAAATEAVTVAPLAPTVAPVAVTGSAGQPIALNLGIAAAGLAGDANKLSSVTIGGIPAGATFANANHDTLTPVNGSLTLSAAQLAAGALTGLSITPSASGAFNLSLAATEQDAEGNASAVTTGAEPVTAGGGGRTISTSVTGPVVLATTDNPLTITSTGSITSTATGADGIDGAAATAWTISNSGSVSSSAALGISLAGSGTVTNSGRISGNEAIRIRHGGSVTNASGGSISASGPVGGGLGVGAGVYIGGASGTVTNQGTISAGAYGVAEGSGGTVSNTGSITGGEDGVIVQGAAGDISNSGTITATVDDGVGLFAGGTVTNAAGATITGHGASGAAIFITGGTGTIANNGTLIADQHNAILVQSGGSLTNGATGSIKAVNTGVFFKTQPGSVTNYGQITATGAQGTGIYLENSGSLTNAQGASVTGAKFGAFFEGGSSTVANYGAIAGGSYDGVVLGQGGSVTNYAGASIKGLTGGVYAKYRASATVTNSGVITTTGSTGAGIDLADGGGVANNSGATVSGADHGIFVLKGAGTVTNQGAISASRYHGVHLGAGGTATNATNASVTGGSAGIYGGKSGTSTVNNSGTITATAASGAGIDLENGGSVTNAAGASISGGGFGVFLTGVSGDVTNDGSIAGGHGVAFEVGGNLVNHVNATVQGQSAGVFAQGAAATVTNSGSITATAAAAAAADIEAGGAVTNNAGANLTGTAYGVFLTGGGTVDNAGTIGGASYAVKFGGSGTNNRLVVRAGAVFNGAVGGASGGTNTLEFASGAGTLSGVSGGSGAVTQNGQSFSFYGGFGTVAVDAGANWTFSGTDSVANISNAGTVAVAGSLTITSAIDPAGAGVFQLGSGATLETAAALGAGTQIAFLGPSTLLADNFAAFGTNVGNSSYAGPQLQDFTAGDKIDLKNFTAAGASAPVYDSGTGLLQISNGAAQAASLSFQKSSLGAGTFQIASDGASGALISLA